MFGVAETRFGPEVANIQIPGYSALRQDRNTHGGGVVLYIKENFKAKVLCSSQTEQVGKPLRPEYLLCSIWQGNSAPILIAIIYRPPDVNIRTDNTFINSLRSHTQDYSHKIIMGDWNANMLDNSNSDTRFLNDLTSDLSVKLVNTGSSHHSEGNDTWIDCIHVDNCDNVLSSARFLPPFSSRHDIITATIDIFHPEPPKIPTTYRALSKITAHELNNHLTNLDWKYFSSDNNSFDIEQSLSILTNNIQTTIDVLAPEKTLKPEKAKCPWLNIELLLLKSKRDATSRRYSRTGSKQLLNEFLSLANKYEEQTEIARCSYMHDRISGTLDANKNFWKEMRSLGLIPKTNDALHGFSPEEINSFFSKISISPSEDPSMSLNIINNTTTQGFVFKEVTTNDVILAVSHFTSQAKGD